MYACCCSRDRKTEAIAELERELDLLKQALQKSQQEVREKCVCVCVCVCVLWFGSGPRSMGSELRTMGNEYCQCLLTRGVLGCCSLPRKWSWLKMPSLSEPIVMNLRPSRSRYAYACAILPTVPSSPSLACWGGNVCLWLTECQSGKVGSRHYQIQAESWGCGVFEKESCCKLWLSYKCFSLLLLKGIKKPKSYHLLGDCPCIFRIWSSKMSWWLRPRLSLSRKLSHSILEQNW